jgi:hypothetical protein
MKLVKIVLIAQSYRQLLSVYLLCEKRKENLTAIFNNINKTNTNYLYSTYSAARDEIIDASIFIRIFAPLHLL